jgi:hypothetical protein
MNQTENLKFFLFYPCINLNVNARKAPFSPITSVLVPSPLGSLETASRTRVRMVTQAGLDQTHQATFVYICL